MDIIKTLAEEFKLKEDQVRKTVELIDGGDTIPFIARYRKELTYELWNKFDKCTKSKGDQPRGACRGSLCVPYSCFKVGIGQRLP